MMEDLRLRAIQQPVHAERLLEALITRGNIVPRKSLTGFGTQMPSLTRCNQVMFNAAQEGRIWMCWAGGLHSWLVTL
jgi:hypothetical protein